MSKDYLNDFMIRATYHGIKAENPELGVSMNDVTSIMLYDRIPKDNFSVDLFTTITNYKKIVYLILKNVREGSVDFIKDLDAVVDLFSEGIFNYKFSIGDYLVQEDLTKLFEDPSTKNCVNWYNSFLKKDPADSRLFFIGWSIINRVLFSSNQPPFVLKVKPSLLDHGLPFTEADLDQLQKEELYYMSLFEGKIST
ncbi:hypothetical protein MKY91_20440 [Alkalicoccobacillus gibsonii]|uniref:Uncharacterized protein n=1 Tax=Alkalicoccobacillus gibsonii TaxID=79881 RepID=A0ABU9VNQ3_9BACI